MFKTRVFFIFLLTIAAVTCSWLFPPTSDNKCGFTRGDALNCVIRHGDLNHDGQLTRDEIRHALNTLVPGYIKPLSWFAGMTMTRIMKDCDVDGNGVLTPRDWEMSKKTCMPTQETLCMLKWFCDRADKQ